MSKSNYVVTDDVYAALGFSEADGLRVKARLAMQIADLIKAKGLSQSQAAELVKMPQPKLSGMLRGQFRGISEAKMMQCLVHLGTDVQIVIRAPAAGARVGKVDVVVRRSIERLSRDGLRPRAEIDTRRGDGRRAASPSVKRTKASAPDRVAAEV